VTNPKDALADAWHHLADECVHTVHTHQRLLNQLSKAGLLSSPTATALTANIDQLEAMAAEIRCRHQPVQRSPGTPQPDQG
jgi:hypothetical protein